MAATRAEHRQHASVRISFILRRRHEAFASNAIYPIEVMPAWLRAISRGNPLSYLVDALRAFMIPAEPSQFGIALDLGVLAIVVAGLVAVTAKLYPTVAT